MSLSEQEFRLHADHALESLQRALMPLADAADVEVGLQNGVLQVVFEDPPAKFVVSPNAPVRQIWVSAISRSYKLAWSAELSAFALDGEPLNALVTRLAHQQLGSWPSISEEPAPRRGRCQCQAGNRHLDRQVTTEAGDLL